MLHVFPESSVYTVYTKGRKRVVKKSVYRPSTGKHNGKGEGKPAGVYHEAIFMANFKERKNNINKIKTTVCLLNAFFQSKY